MKSIMIKSVCAVIAVSAVLLACSGNLWKSEKQTAVRLQPVFDEDGYWKTPDFRVKQHKDGKYSYYSNQSLYGAYLAGRIAHLRNDLDTAAEYYKIVLEKDAKNSEINRYTYVILTSTGNLNQAAVYAQKEIDSGQKGTIAPVIVAIKNFNDGKYDEVRRNLTLLNNDPLYKKFINPLFNAWAYAGDKNEAEAVKALAQMDAEPPLRSIKIFHEALIYDYLGNHGKAEEKFSYLLNELPQEVTFRILEVATNFYVRSGDKEKARKISAKYNDNSTLALLLAEIDRQIDLSGTDTPAIINTPQKGLAEALFNIGTIFRLSTGGENMARIYIAASAFLNPDYDISKIALANQLEENGLLKEANKYYASIKKSSGSYFIARLKLIENLNGMKEYAEAEELLRQLLKDYPDNTQLLIDLGDIVSNMHKNGEAIKIYKKAVSTLKKEDGSSWPVFYALGVTYYKEQQFEEAETNLLKALRLSNNNAGVSNYLGYIWLTRNKNLDDAVKMIISAYRQYPYEGHIIDSLGWVYYRLGEYRKSITYLEQAADINPGNAVISDHLGDAYWHIGRKNEAVFQWRHALDLKEDADMIDRDAVQKKIDTGDVNNVVLQLKDRSILTDLEKNDDENEKSSENTRNSAAK